MSKKHLIVCLAAINFVLTTSAAAFAKSKKVTSSKVLRAVEDYYRSAKTVKMNVTKTVTMKILEKEKKSEGVIEVKRGGRLRWETKEPDHSLIVVTKQAVWFVEYPHEEGEKVSVLKASNPKKSQPHALVAFLLGEGHITNNFKVDNETLQSGGRTLVELKPKTAEEQIHWLKVLVNSESKEIEKLTFEDSVGNQTQMDFSSVKFNKPIDDKEFKFQPPPNSEVTVIE